MHVFYQRVTIEPKETCRYRRLVCGDVAREERETGVKKSLRVSGCLQMKVRACRPVTSSPPSKASCTSNDFQLTRLSSKICKMDNQPACLQFGKYSLKYFAIDIGGGKVSLSLGDLKDGSVHIYCSMISLFWTKRFQAPGIDPRAIAVKRRRRRC